MFFSRYFPNFTRLFLRLLCVLSPRVWCTWRHARRALAGVASLATLIALFYAVENWRGRRALDAALREAKVFRLPTPAVAVPDEENFARAPVVVELQQLKKERPKEWEPRWQLETMGKGNMPPYPGLPFPPVYNSRGTMDEWRAYLGTDDLVRYLAPRAEDMARFAEAASRPRYVLAGPLDLANWTSLVAGPMDVFSMLPIFVVRAGARLERGDAGGAAEDITTVLRVAALTHQERLTLVQMLAYAEARFAIELIRLGLRDVAWSDAQLAAFGAELARLDFLTSAARGLGSDMELVVVFSESDSSLRASVATASGSSWLKYCLIPSGWVRQNGARVVHYAEERLLPCWDLKKRRVDIAGFRALDSEIGSGKGPYSWLVAQWLHGLTVIGISSANAEAQVGLTRLALALERWRLAHAEYPETLGELPADWGVAGLRDPATGESFRYRRTNAKTYKLYSLGVDGRDDGGAKYVDPASLLQGEGDWVW